MSLENFIPEVWSARLLVNLYNTLVYGNPALINTDYEGEIRSQGDTVRIGSIGTVTVGDYSKNTDITAPQTLSDAQSTLTITQQKYFNFQIDDVDKAQQNPKVMGDAMREAAYALANTADKFIAGQYTDIPTANYVLSADAAGGSADGAGNDVLIVTGGTVATKEAIGYEFLVDGATVLDNNNVPEEGRWVVVPPWYEGVLLKDPRFVSFGTPQAMANLSSGGIDGSTMRPTGQIGRVAGFDVYKSNNVPSTSGTYQVLFGHNMAWTFAQQVQEVEAYRPEKRFADAVKGLQLYGAKVVRPQAMALGKVRKGTH